MVQSGGAELDHAGLLGQDLAQVEDALVPDPILAGSERLSRFTD